MSGFTNFFNKNMGDMMSRYFGKTPMNQLAEANVSYMLPYQNDQFPMHPRVAEFLESRPTWDVVMEVKEWMHANMPVHNEEAAGLPITSRTARTHANVLSPWSVYRRQEAREGACNHAYVWRCYYHYS